MEAIRLVVGLGNPGREYEDTRHNVGFWWVEALAREYGLSFRTEAKFHGLLARGTVHGQELLLLKPATYMNRSGQAVGAVAQFYKVLPGQMLVVHDELDLPPGTAKLKTGGGHGGHNGLRDIIAHLGSRDFWRLRLGIGHPGDKAQVANFVLHAPGREERAAMDIAMENTARVTPQILAGQLEAAMLKLHSQK